VAPDGNDDESTGPRGTFARPFQTIAKALQQSDSNQTANAAALTRIALRDGIYSGSSNRVENVALGTNGRGGALHLIGARGTMSSCEFVRNQCATTSSGSTTNSGSASGGAVYQRGRGNPVNNGTDSFWFRRCLFRENEAGKHGGATRNSGGRMFLYWCAFVRNTAGDAGGAHASSTGSATAIRETDLNHCTIFENYSRFAGALQVPPSTTTRLLNSLLHGNESRESTPEANRVVTASANTNDPVGTVVVSGTNHQAGAFASGITPAADSYSAVPRMAWDGIHLASPTATNGQSLLGRTVVAHSLATNPIGMGATPPTDWDNELLTANASSSTVVPSESGCDDWRDSDSDQLPDWYETHIAALSARDGLNSVNELTPSLVLWGSRWNLLQMLQLGADPGLPDASQADTDGDGLTDPRERQLLTQLYHWDSDGDGMADGWEDRYNLDPRSATGSNGAAADIDGDGLSNLDESRHGTNPHSADTDSDGRSDAQETQNGSDPDTFDQPVPPGHMRLVRFRFGDPSGSLSEKYRLAVSGFDGRQFSSVNTGFNIVDGVDWQFRSGIRYAVSLHYLATKMSDGLMRPQPDYDCEVLIETDSTPNGLFQPSVAMGPRVNWRTAPNPRGEYFPITLRRNPANGLASLPPSTWIADNESHVLGQHWKPDFHNSKFEIQGKSALLMPVEIVDKDKKAVSKLKVGKMSEAGVLTGTGASATLDIDKDSDRFFVRVAGGGSLGGISIKVSTTDNPDHSITTPYNDNATQLDLETDGEDTITKSLLMVSDHVDDHHPVGGIGDDAIGDRTHRVQLGGNFMIEEIKISTGPWQALGTKVPVPVEKSVEVTTVILRNKPEAEGGVELIPLAVVTKFWMIAMERYAQCGVRLNVTHAGIKDPPTGVDLIDGLNLTDSFPDDFESGEAFVSREAKDLITGLGTGGSNTVIRVFYVNSINHAGFSPDGAAIADFAYAPGDDAFTYNVVLTNLNLSPWGGYAAAHELRHLLTNGGHKDSDGTTFPLWHLMHPVLDTNGISGSRRFKQSDATRILSNPHAH